MIPYCPGLQFLDVDEPSFNNTGRYAAVKQKLDDGIANIAAFGLVFVARKRGTVM